MTRLLFLLTLALYGSSALELHEWVQVPQVLVHNLVHHSDLGHQDGPAQAAGDHGDHEHNPFDDGCGEEFCACHAPALIATRPQVALSLPMKAHVLAPATVGADVMAHSGSKWNPPRPA